MSELSQALEDLVSCGERIIRTANAIREAFTGEASEPPCKKADAPVSDDQPKKYTFIEVRKAFSAKSHAGYTEQIKALITSYGADRLSAVKEEDYARLMADLEAIG